MDNSKSDANNQKKDPFEKLSKEELTKKCKQFLAIAQKAKQAKDELVEENKELNRKLKDIDKKSEGDIKTLQEMVDVLTEQKLKLVTDYDILLKQKQSSDNQIKEYRDELSGVKSTVESLETQLQCFRRQVSRLTEENEVLIAHLNANEKEIHDLTALGEQQREQLLSLERESKQCDSAEATESAPHTHHKSQLELQTEQLQAKCSQLESDLEEHKSSLNEKTKILEQVNDEINSFKQKHKDIEELQERCRLNDTKIEKLHSVISDLNQDISVKNDSIRSLTAQNEQLLSELQSKSKSLEETDSKCANLLTELENTKKCKQVYNEKLKCYHAKLVKVFADVKDLKQHKVNLLAVIDDYASYINKWQRDIKLVSCKYKEEIERCNSTIDSLENENSKLKSTCEVLKLKLSESHENTNNEQQSAINIELQKVQKQLEDKENIILELSAENEFVVKSVQEYKQRIEQLNLIFNKNQVVEDKLKEYEENIRLLSQKFTLIKDSLVGEKGELLNEIQEKHQKMLLLEEENKELLKILHENKQEIEAAKEMKSLLNNLRQEKNNLLDILENNKLENKTLLEESNRLNEVIASINSELQYLREIKETKVIVEAEYNKNIEKLKLAEVKIILLSEENNSLKENDMKLVSSNEILEKSNSDLMKELETKTNENILSVQEKEHLLKTIELLNEELKSFEKIKDTNSSLMKENEKLVNALSTADTVMIEFRTIIDDYKNKFKNEFSNGDLLKKFTEEKEALMEKIDTFNEKLSEIDSRIAAHEKENSELKNQLAISKRENTELLKEMNVMNEALKDRGETISKQQEYAQELLKKVQSMEQEMNANKQSQDKLEEENKQLKTQAAEQDVPTSKEQIQKLEEEIQQLREALANSGRETQDGVYGDSETMSTSTVSRSDEAARLRDLEGSWEERYTKLRTLAIKQKVKLKEITEQLAQERTEKSEMQSRLSTTTRNLQLVQTEYDKMHDQYEMVSKQIKMYTKQIDALTTERNKYRNEVNQLSADITKLQMEIDSMKIDKSNSELLIKQLMAQIHNLKRELDKSNTLKNEAEHEMTKFGTLLIMKDEELQKEVKAHNLAKEQLLKYNKEIKKNSVLSLEMEDYERSLKELSLKLEKKNERINELELKLSKQESVMTSMKGEISQLEEKISTGESVARELENELVKGKTKISEYEAIISQKDNRIREIMRSLEEFRTSNEEMNEEMSYIISQNQREIESLKTEKDYYRCQILGLEEKVRELVTTLKDREQELLHLQTEYSNYKVRAQSVLRQNQTRDLAVEERMSEELDELESRVEMLTAQLREVTSELEFVKKQYELAEKENTANAAQCSELEKLLAKEKLENDSLLARQQTLIKEHREAMRSQKVHTDTLAQCYKQQLAEQEERHVKEIAELRAARNHPSHSQPLGDEHPHTSARRNDGESSETAESVYNNNVPAKSAPVSLDKLLSMDVENISVDYESELSSCKKQINEYEAKIAHLTALLADAEQDLAKHAQLNQLLKEDIRRHQRSIEREKHAENLEYLKNVVFKFLTLHNGDEKSRLVPVLNTILKLSPEETQKLNSVAKGADTSLRSWGSYLPLWNTSNNQ